MVKKNSLNVLFSFLAGVLVLVLLSPDATARVLALKSLPDYGNAQVILSPLNKEDSLYLIKVIGVPSIKERILVAKENPNTRNSKNYSPFGFKGFRLYDDKRKKTIVSGTLMQTYQLYIKGQRDPLVFVADPALLKGMQSNPLKNEFLAKEFLSKDRISAPMVGELEKKLTKDFKVQCGGSVSLKYSTKSTQAKLRGLRAAESLVELCKEDEDYKASIATIKTLNFGVAKKGSVAVKKSGKSGFMISSSSENYNSIDVAKEWFLNNLE